MTAAIRTENLVKRYGRTPVLDGLCMDVPEGAIYALVGPNGAGKTTTIHTLLNLIAPTAGRSEVLGVDSRRLGAADFARIGYVSENQKLPGWMRVSEFLDYLKPFYPTWDDALAAELLRQFDLPAERKLKELSRGMRLKAALASALAFHPRILVLDEPFSGLDALVRDDLIQGMLERADETTILISSHDLAEIESFSSHFGYLEGRKLQFSEEMTALTARFREVEVTLETESDLPAPWPAGWMPAERAALVVRFVETAFEPEGTAAKVRAVFGAVRGVEIRPMALRAIFVALAKRGRR